MKSDKYLTVRLPESELEILKRYCEMTGRRQTDVVREWVRDLEAKCQKLSKKSKVMEN